MLPQSDPSGAKLISTPSIPQLVSQDFEMYEALWQNLISDETSLASLRSLDMLAQTLQAQTGIFRGVLHAQLQCHSAIVCALRTRSVRGS